MIGDRLFAIEPIGNIFCLLPALFEIPNYRLTIKPLACLGTDFQ